MSVSATYLGKSGFHRELHERINAYFAASGKRRRGGAAMYWKTAVMLLWLAGAYAALVFWVSTPVAAVLTAICLGLAMAGVGFNVQHDGNHGAYSDRPWLNHVMALTLDLMGGTATYWHYKHNIAHHTHPNVDGHDDDIDVGVLGRFSPHQRWRWPYRAQHLYMWFVYGLLAFEWQTTGEFRNYFHRKAYGVVRLPRLSAAEHVTFWGGKIVFFGLAFALPLSRHSLGSVIALFLVTSATLGFVLAVVFQLAHCAHEAEFRQVTPSAPVVPRGWAEHQVESTVDFARRNRVLSWYLGGLNFQIEHHLFPKICHIHYHALAPIVEDTCRAHGVRYSSHPTMRAALGSHFRFLRAMGRAEPAVAH